jgi:hypothetical protein
MFSETKLETIEFTGSPRSQFGFSGGVAGDTDFRGMIGSTEEREGNEGEKKSSSENQARCFEREFLPA